MGEVDARKNVLGNCLKKGTIAVTRLGECSNAQSVPKRLSLARASSVAPIRGAADEEPAVEVQVQHGTAQILQCLIRTGETVVTIFEAPESRQRLVHRSSVTGAAGRETLVETAILRGAVRFLHGWNRIVEAVRKVVETSERTGKIACRVGVTVTVTLFPDLSKKSGSSCPDKLDNPQANKLLNLCHGINVGLAGRKCNRLSFGEQSRPGRQA